MKFLLNPFGQTFNLTEIIKGKPTLKRIIWPLCGILMLELIYLAILPITSFSIFKFILLVIIGSIGGRVIGEKFLAKGETKRRSELRNDFPYFAECLALCVTAGLSPVMSIKAIMENEISENFSEALFIELQQFLNEINNGSGISSSLDHLAKRINLPEIYRFVDALIVTMERGTPLAEVLRQQALDLRESQRRELLDLGNKAELKMMIPVVFLILPVSILFALWPSLYQLNQMNSF